MRFCPTSADAVEDHGGEGISLFFMGEGMSPAIAVVPTGGAAVDDADIAGQIHGVGLCQQTV